LCEGFKTLRQLPLKGAPLGFGKGWPVAYLYEWQDLFAQQEQEQAELEKTMRAQNRVRLQPSLAEVTRCEAVIGWGGQYLSRSEHLCTAVNMVALRIRWGAMPAGAHAGVAVMRIRGGSATTRAVPTSRAA
jgi:hypothetical protein